MLFRIKVFLWAIVAELEYHLYPWTEKAPPQDVAQKYNLPESDFDKNLHYDWIQSHDQKISRLQEEMIWVQKEIHKLNNKMETND
jgi:peptidoglycan hydrolase CwlO-like protein